MDTVRRVQSAVVWDVCSALLLCGAWLGTPDNNCGEKREGARDTDAHNRDGWAASNHTVDSEERRDRRGLCVCVCVYVWRAEQHTVMTKGENKQKKTRDVTSADELRTIPCAPPQRPQKHTRIFPQPLAENLQSETEIQLTGGGGGEGWRQHPLTGPHKKRTRSQETKTPPPPPPSPVIL